MFITACGGGGGGGGSGGTNPATVNTEYESSFALRQVNAVRAYTDQYITGGVTGEGVDIGIVDGGFFWQGNGGVPRSHSEFANRIATPATADQVDRSDGMLPDPSVVDDNNFNGLEHGIGVASILAAARGNGNTHGIAPGVRLHLSNFNRRPIATDDGSNSPTGNVDLADINDVAMRDTIMPLISQANILAINNSWGFLGEINDTDSATGMPLYTAANLKGDMANPGAMFRFITAMEQVGTALGERKIMVWAAGNGNNMITGTDRTIRNDGSELEVLPGIAYRLTPATPLTEPIQATQAALHEHTIAVVALDNTGNIHANSNRCGMARAYCMAAPGADPNAMLATVDRGAPDDQAEYRSSRGESGTSFAAPLVTGALALLEHRLNSMGTNMGNHELVDRLFATATDIGAVGDDAIYGHGRLNVDAFLSMPVGSISLRLGRSLSDSAAFSAADSGLSLSAPFVSLRNAAADYEVEVYDSINTPFRYSLQSFLPDEVNGNDALERLLAARMLDGRLLGVYGDSYSAAYTGMSSDGRSLAGNKFWVNVGDNNFWFASGVGAMRNFAEPLFAGVHGFVSPFSAMSEGGFALGVQGAAIGDSVWQLESYIPGTHHRSTDTINTLGLVASLAAFKGDTPWRFSLGMLHEGDTVLASTGTGAFSGLGASTWYGGLELAHHIGAWSAYASGHFGYTDGSAGDNGIWQGIDDVRSSSWAIGLLRRGVFTDVDAFGVRVVQSLRSGGGSVAFNLPERRDKHGNLYSDSVKLSSKPDGRELDVALGWQGSYNGLANFSMDMGVTTEPNHVAGSSSVFWAGLAWMQRF